MPRKNAGGQKERSLNRASTQKSRSKQKVVRSSLEPFSVRMKRNATKQEFQNYERDPTAALISLFRNSGLSRFKMARALYGKSNKIDTSDVVSKEVIGMLTREVKKDFQASEWGRIVDQFQNDFNLTADLKSCACCGMRSFEMGSTKFIHIDIRKLPILKYTTEQQAYLNSIPSEYKPIISHFKSTTTSEIYHLHPEFVSSTHNGNGNINELATICPFCATYLSPTKKRIPPLSIAAGVDYGVPSRANLPPLTLIEQYVIARSRLYASIVKLSGPNTTQSHNARTGHAITFPQPESAELVAEFLKKSRGGKNEIFPRLKGLSEVIAVVFIGAMTRKEALLPNRLKAITGLKIRLNVVLAWLRALKAINPHYANIEIDETLTEEDISLVTDELVENTRMASSELEVTMERLASEERNTTLSEELSAESNLLESNNAHKENDVTDHTNFGDAEEDWFSQMPSSFLLKASHENTALAESRVFKSLDLALSGESPALQNEETVQIQIPSGSKPMNEFTGNDRVQYGNFAFLFVTGKGLQNQGSVGKRQLRHMLMQFHCNFQTCSRFTCSLFDKLQRHAAAQSVAAAFNNRPESLEKLQSWVADPAFLNDLKKAAKDPVSAKSRALLGKITPHIQTFGSTVPYSPTQRKASMQHLYAMLLHFGMPGIFVTFAPDFTNGVLNLQLSIPSKDNASLPANDDGLLEALRGDCSVHKTIPISKGSLLGRTTSSPVAMAELFRIYTDVFFTDLVGIKPDGSTRQTPPIDSRKPGLFGTVVGAYGVVEEQARGTPHCHAAIWGGLSPQLVQAAPAAEALMDAVAESYDYMVRARLEPKTIAKHLLGQFSGEKLVTPSTTIAHNPITDPIEFASDVQNAAIVTNIHSHTFTCHKGVQGKESCRLSRPAPTAEKTHCVQLLCHRNASTGKVEYAVSKKPLPPPIDCLPGRDISRTPVSKRDPNLHFWELKRPVFKITNEDGDIIDNDLLKEYLGNDLMDRYEQLNIEEKWRFVRAFEMRNGMVVEFNPVMTVLLGCNTNVSILGSDSQAKAILSYLLKYITKPPTELSHSLTVILSARQYIEKHPSSAEDSDTEKRKVMYFFTRVFNQLFGTVEVSEPIAALALLGMPAEICSHSFQLVFASAAVAFAVNEQQSVEDDVDFADITRESVTNSLDDSTSSDATGTEDEEEPEEFIKLVSSDDHCLGDEDEDKLHGPNDEDEVNSSATVYKSGKDRKAVMQHTHYAFRGIGLIDYSLYEYAAAIVIVPKAKKNNEQTATGEIKDDTNQSEHEDCNHPGRLSNTSFEFHPSHPLFKSHCQRIRSKSKVPVTALSPPKPPPSKPSVLTPEWRTTAKVFARYILVLFRPWTENGGTLPSPLTWTEFCKFMEDLEFSEDRSGPPTDAEIVRRRWIENASQGLRVSTIEKTANVLHRCRAATRWGKDDFSGNMAVSQDYLEDDSPPIEPLVEQEARAIIDQWRMQAASNKPTSSLYSQKKARYHKDAAEALQSVTQTLFSSRNPQYANSQIAAGVILYNPASNELSPELVFKKLKPDFREEANDVTLIGTTGPGVNPSIIEEHCSLNLEQARAVRVCSDFLRKKREHLDGVGNYVKPLELIIHGGPGTGKSFLIKKIVETAETYNLRVVCMALTGIAAGLLPDGDTCHHTLCLSIAATDHYPRPLKPEKLTQLRNSLDRERLSMIIIDEISFVKTEMYSIISRRMSEIMGVDLPYGGLSVVTLGDFYQLPPVPPDTLFSAVVDLFLRSENGDSTDSETRKDGARLFRRLKKIELTQQMRAADDPIHISMMEKLRSRETLNPITDELLNSLPVLCSNDVRKDPEWAFAPIIVTSNDERLTINAFQSKKWALSEKMPRVTWKYNIVGSLSSLTVPSVKDYIYESVPHLTGHFAYKAPGYLSNNINPGRKLSNGTPVIYEGFKLHENEDIEAIFNAFTTTDTNNDIKLKYPPTYIIVSIPGANPDEFKGRTMVPGRVVIPVPIKRTADTVNVTLPGQLKSTKLKYHPHGVELRFALTGYKVQGQNCKKLILQLNERPFVPKITFNSLLVSLSRVQRGDDIRIMPLHSASHGMHYLTELRPDDAFIDWNDGFEEDLGSGALWDIEKARRMYALRHSKEELSTSNRNDGDKMANENIGKTTTTKKSQKGKALKRASNSIPTPTPTKRKK